MQRFGRVKLGMEMDGKNNSSRCRSLIFYLRLSFIILPSVLPGVMYPSNYYLSEDPIHLKAVKCSDALVTYHLILLPCSSVCVVDMSADIFQGCEVCSSCQSVW